MRSILLPKQMRELASLGLDTSDASLYINDVSADGIDNGQMLINMYPNDGSRQHEIDHNHVIFIYTINDASKHIPKANCEILMVNGKHRILFTLPSGEQFLGENELQVDVLFEAIKFCLEHGYKY